jgi:hypothetical protein
LFKLKHIPARYDVTNKTILPPTEVVTFEETLTDDGSLLEWISQKEHLVSAIAQLKMNKYLDEFRRELKKGNTVVIPGVGQLKADVVGRLSFEQEAPLLTRDILHVSPVIRTDPGHKVTVGTKEVVNQQVVDHLTAASAPQAQTAAEGPEVEGYPEESSSRYTWLWIAIPIASVLAAAGVWWSVSKKTTENKSVNTATAADTTPAQQNQVAADSAIMEPAVPAGPVVLDYDIIYKTYHNERKTAESKHKQQVAWGHPVVIRYNEDSSIIKLGMNFQTPAADTTRMKDSVRIMYGNNLFLELRKH